MNKQLIVILGIIVCLLVYCRFIEPNSLKVTKYSIEDSDLAGIRVVFLADLHLNPHDFGKLNRVVKLVQAQQPDAVIIGGDFAYKQGDLRRSMNMNAAGNTLRKIYNYTLQENVPIFAVLGNYDNLSDPKKIREQLSANNIIVIDDNSKAKMTYKDPKQAI